jgi:hypothetical protein
MRSTIKGPLLNKIDIQKEIFIGHKHVDEIFFASFAFW